MADRDVAQILQAHCDGGIEVTRAIASLKVSADIAAVADSVRRNEERDRAAIASWIASQSGQPSAAGTTHESEIRKEHAAVVEQLRQTVGADLDEHVLRVLVSHHNEELELIGTTPVKDDNLRRIVDGIWRRLSDEVKLLSRRLPQ